MIGLRRSCSRPRLRTGPYASSLALGGPRGRRQAPLCGPSRDGATRARGRRLQKAAARAIYRHHTGRRDVCVYLGKRSTHLAAAVAP